MPEGLALASAVARIEADPVGLEIMWSRLINIVEECWLTVWRTAFSLRHRGGPGLRLELLDPRGDSLAHSPRAMPVFNLTLPRAVRAIMERVPAETLAPGDILITNDPWICAGHLLRRGHRDASIPGGPGGGHPGNAFVHVTDIGGAAGQPERPGPRSSRKGSGSRP